MEFWRQYLDGLNALRDERGMTIVQIAHTDIKRFDSPEHDPYDRYVIKLHTRAAALLQEHADIVLFANYRISTVKADVGFNKKVNRALGSGERVIHTAERPAFWPRTATACPTPCRSTGRRSRRRCRTACKKRSSVTESLFLPQRRTAMASFGHTFDASTVEPTTPFEVFPPGKYRVQLVASEMRPPRTAWGNTCSSNSMCSKVRTPGASFFDRLNLVNANPDAVLMAQRSLSALCRAAGKMQVSNSEQLHLIPIQIDVKVRPPKGQYGESNSIRYLSGSDTQPMPPAAPVPAAPAGHARAASPAAQSTLPWKRQG
jgi:hypothetical protein